MLPILETAILFLTLGLLVLLVLFIFALVGSRRSGRYEIGGGIRVSTDTGNWAKGLERPDQRILKDWDVKLLSKLSYSGENTIDDIIAYLQESTPTIGERLARLEAKGFIMKTSSGSIIITEKGRKYVESLREKLWYRRREKELLEKKQ